MYDEEDLFFIEEEKLNNIQCDNNLAIEIIGNRVDKISYDQKDISFEEIIKQIEKILKGNARVFIKKNEKLIKDLYNGANELKSVGIRFDDYIGCNIGMNGHNYIIFDLGYSKSPAGQIDIVEQKYRKIAEYDKVCRLTSNLDVIKLAIDVRINFSEAVELINKACAYFKVVNPPVLKIAHGHTEYAQLNTIHLKQFTNVHSALHELTHYIGEADDIIELIDKKVYKDEVGYLKQKYGDNIPDKELQMAKWYARKGYRANPHGPKFVKKLDELLSWWKNQDFLNPCKKELTEVKLVRIDPRLTKIFKNNEIIIYLVDGDVVRKDFDIQFTSGGNAGRYPKFTPTCDIWVESTLGDKDKLFNAAHEIVERYLMLFNNVDYDTAHAKASDYELAIRKREVKDPIKFAIDTTNLCKINWFLRQSQRSNGLWPGFLCDGQIVDLEQFSNRCMGKCAESKIYCPICGKMMYQLKDGQEKKFTGFFDSHKLSENINDWISDEMVKWFEERTKKHISLVQKYCEKIYKYDPDRFEGIIERGREHDSSKYKGIERNPYIIISWSYKAKDNGGKPLEFPKYIKDKLNEATLHHITTNQHHPDYWSPRKTSLLNNNDRDKLPEKIIDATVMDDLSICEMCCDWMGISDEKGSDVVEWAKNNINKRWKFTDDQEQLIWEIISVGIQ
jgi:hypothetical protein